MKNQVVALAFCALSLGSFGCAASSELEDAAATDESAVAARTTIKIEKCEEIATNPLRVGSKLVLDVPSAFDLTEVMSIEKDFALDYTSRAGARGRRVYTFDTNGPEEYFVRLGRIQFLKEVGAGSTEAKSCDFEGQKAGWKWVRASDWTGGGDIYSPPREMDRDLGDIPVGGGLLVEAYPFSTDDSIRTWIVEKPGSVAPVRTTQLSEYGSGTHVFRATEPGEYRFDMRVLATGYINSHNHVRFRVVR